MWFFDLVIIVVLSLIGYTLINRRILDNTGLKDAVKKYRDEIDGVTVAFNRTAADNVTLLTGKIAEARESLRLLEKKSGEARKLIEDLEGERKRFETRKKELTQADLQNRILGGLEKTIAETRGEPVSRRKQDSSRKSQDKQTVILAYFEKGQSVQEIADNLDISPEEVRYYIDKDAEL